MKLRIGRRKSSVHSLEKLKKTDYTDTQHRVFPHRTPDEQHGDEMVIGKSSDSDSVVLVVGTVSSRVH